MPEYRVYVTTQEVRCFYVTADTPEDAIRMTEKAEADGDLGKYVDAETIETDVYLGDDRVL